MKFGAQVGVYRNTWEEIASVAKTMDRGRWDSIWFADHFIPSSWPTRRRALDSARGIYGFIGGCGDDGATSHGASGLGKHLS